MLPDYDDDFEQVAPVGTYVPNGYGLFDITGNVWEWCADWFGEYSVDDLKDPRGPPTGTMRILRGAGWGAMEDQYECAYRRTHAPQRCSAQSGFRCVLSLP